MRYRPLLAILLALCLSVFAVPAKAAKAPLTYDQIRNTGKAAICPSVSDNARGRIEVPRGGSLKLTDVCFQPVQIEVEEEKRNGEKEFIKAKNIMISAATLGPIKAEVTPKDGALELKVVDGITFQPTTGQMPRRELVPFLFSVKDLVATAQGSAIDPSTDFEGEFLVPGYHSSTFLDPRGRGSNTGYDTAVGLQAAKDDFATNRKVDEVSQGKMSLRIARVDASTGEMAGSFVSVQPSSTEQGAMEPHTVRIQGLFYARLAGES
jgi:photosystem II oxygen-evolving enhancer protein 1